MSALTWDPTNLDERKNARRIVLQMRDRGYLILQGGKPVKDFDPDAGEVQFVQKQSRYDRLGDEDGNDCTDF